MLALTCFLIGLGLSRQALRELGIRPLFQALALWGKIASASLGAIEIGLIG